MTTSHTRCHNLEEGRFREQCSRVYQPLSMPTEDHSFISIKECDWALVNKMQYQFPSVRLPCCDLILTCHSQVDRINHNTVTRRLGGSRW